MKIEIYVEASKATVSHVSPDQIVYYVGSLSFRLCG